jgi:DNA polymerase III delta prime subunit
MKIRLYKNLCEKMGADVLEHYGIRRYDAAWHSFEQIDLSVFTVEKIKDLRKELELHTKGKLAGRAKAVIRNIDTWFKILAEGPGEETKVKTIDSFPNILAQYLSKVPGPRVFMTDLERDVKFCYYVAKVEAVKGRTYRSEYTPPHTNVQLIWTDFGVVKEKTISFYASDVVNLSIETILARQGLIIETLDLRKDYVAEVERFKKASSSVGQQFLASGIASDDIDGNKSEDEEENRWWRDTKVVKLDKDGEKSNVVIDVFFENTKKSEDDDDDNASFDPGWWLRHKTKAAIKDEDDDEAIEDADTSGVEVPCHPMLACFALRKQVRLKIHVSQLEDYHYDKTLAEKLILPKNIKGLITTLMAHGLGFKDITKGKSQGAVVLCAGPPGVGKTLTAEIFSESAERPLYSVQCSQLGTDSKELEENLLKIFARAQRWKAILLLDEADVYIRKRMDDVQQNAIVGVFLRTLEYFNGLLFLATNKGDSVDDAIASRCVARVAYELPVPEDLHKIWKVISDTSGAGMTDADISTVVKEFPHLSGRDVKNLLKLGIMINAEKSDKRVTAATVKEVKRFKPTVDIKED